MSGTGPPGEPGDGDLVRLAQRGDRSAFDRLIVRHQERIFGLVYRMLGDRERAADTTQDAFVKAYAGLPRFRGDAAFSTWMYRIALNQARSELRQKRNPGPREISLFAGREDGDVRTEEIPDRTYEPTRMVGQRETAETIQAVLASLDEGDRELIVLRDVEGLGYDEIARVTERPLGTVKSTLHRARLKFVERYRLAVRDAASVRKGVRVQDRGALG